MNLLASETVLILNDQQRIFDYISNMENFSEWFVGVEGIESLNDLAHGQVGKSYLETVKIPFRGSRKVKIAVVKAESPDSFATEGTLSPIKPRMEITVRNTSEGNEVSWSMYSRNDNVWFTKLILPLVRNEMSKRAKRSIIRLKAKLEA